jgi:hypothetical protein
MSFGSGVTLVNRSSVRRSFTFDGRQYDLQPGPNPNVPRQMVPFAIQQNRVMGTEDPSNPESFSSLIGCVEDGDPCDPIEQSTAVEAIDRRLVMDVTRREADVVVGGGRQSRSALSGSLSPQFVTR